MLISASGNAHNEIKIFCLLDRDYHTEDEIESRLSQAKVMGVELTVWTAKEIENYIIVPATITRMINAKTTANLTTVEVQTTIDSFVQARKDETFDSFAETYRRLDPKHGADGANKAARPLFNKSWAISNGLFTVSGKQLLSDICGWAQTQYKVSLSASQIVSAMTSSEVHQEVVAFISSVTAK
ncbi:MAG TPA: hypothetical protein VMI53_09840 [Opitutaceae bacterium]|nr:hypothetical protein [Opitutaceae bacterium]